MTRLAPTTTAVALGARGVMASSCPRGAHVPVRTLTSCDCGFAPVIDRLATSAGDISPDLRLITRVWRPAGPDATRSPRGSHCEAGGNSLARSTAGEVECGFRARAR